MAGGQLTVPEQARIANRDRRENMFRGNTPSGVVRRKGAEHRTASTEVQDEILVEDEAAES
jgi:hypothetical protein